jgi:probable F420-dependent oxidoreductase
MPERWGVTLPLTGVTLPDQRDLVAALPTWGYTDIWSMEADGTDAFTPLAAFAGWAPDLRLGTAVVPVFTRGPGLIAMSAAALSELAPGRFVLGLGASSPAVVQAWNAIEFDRPVERTRDVVDLVRRALAGERVTADLATLSVQGLRLARPPATPPPIMIAALRPRMLALAGEIADGVILNWLAAGDVGRCRAAVGNPDTEVVARIFVCPTDDADAARAVGRRMIAGYLTVPAYAAFHRWLGRGEKLAGMWRAWADGDRRGALAALADDTVDELVIHGSPARCREQVRAYVAAGVHTPVIALVPTPEMTDPATVADLVRQLGPNGG